ALLDSFPSLGFVFEGRTLQFEIDERSVEIGGGTEPAAGAFRDGISGQDLCHLGLEIAHRAGVKAPELGRRGDDNTLSVGGERPARELPLHRRSHPMPSSHTDQGHLVVPVGVCWGDSGDFIPASDLTTRGDGLTSISLPKSEPAWERSNRPGYRCPL